MMWNNSQVGYINNFVSNFPLKKFVPIFLIFFSRMVLTQDFKRKRNHSIPSWYEESKNSKTGLKNWNKLCSWTSEGKKTYLEANFEVPNIEHAYVTI